MSKRTLDLVMTFKTASGSNSNITVKGVKENLTSDAIGAVMDSIVAKAPFYSTGGALVAKVKADIVDKTVSSFELA